MKKSLSGLDLISLRRDLQTLVGGRVDKVYQPGKDMMELSISTKDAGKLRLRVRLDGWIWVSRESADMPLLPSQFAAQLRKNIGNSRIVGISQRGSDRIVELSLQKTVDFCLIFELFSEGNVILTSKGRIIALLRRRKMKHRDLRVKGEYAYPPETFDPNTASKIQFIDLMKVSSADAVRTLATKINLGGDLAEEVCHRAQVEKGTPAKELDEEELEKLWESIKGLVDELKGDSSPGISFKNGAAENVFPIRLSKEFKSEIKEFARFSEAIEEYVSDLPLEIETESQGAKELGKLERTLEKQERTVSELKKEIEGSQAIAEFIYTNYQRIEGTISSARRVADGGEEREGIEILDRAKRTFRTDLDGLNLTLCWKKDVNENAQIHYDAAKRMRSKVEGAERAISETKKEIADLKKREKDSKDRIEKKVRKGARAWYESYRWFFSSEGALVLAGKDAKSNDQLVKKHLQAGDRYVHADIHGAPSVVVKRKEGMTEGTLREAATFGLAMSKAWNAGIGSGSAYWVTPEQVSKTPQSGESLPRGAWVIRGKRNHFEKLELRLAVGIALIDGEEKAMCGPVEAVRANCGKFVEIVPGDLDKEDAAKDFASRFAIDISDVQPVLPPGDLKIIE